MSSISSSELPVDTVVGEYRVTGRLGEGGMGVVYSGVHPVLGRKVAIKVLGDEFARSDEGSRRFIGEARAACQVRHRNIVDVFAFGQLSDGRHYLVMELLEGQSLAGVLEDRQVLPSSLVHVVLDGVLQGLEAAHKKGIIHRDLKPDNVIVSGLEGEEPEIKILDFGLAKITGPAAESSVKTRSGVPMGTPAYMSPEQCRAVGTIDARTDLYSLGVMMYEMLVGQLPFDAASVFDVMTMHLGAPVPSPSALTGMPQVLERVILKAMAKQPADRFASATEMRQALKTACEAAAGFVNMRPPPKKRGQDSPTAFGHTMPSDGARPEAKSHQTVPPVSLGASQVPRRKAPLRVVIGLGVAALGAAAAMLWPRATPVPTPAPSSPANVAPAPAPAAAPVAAPPVAAPAPSSLRIEVSPPARVLVDGKRAGEGSAVVAADLTPGDHMVRVEADGRVAWEKAVTLQPGERRTLEMELKPAPRGKTKPKPRGEAHHTLDDTMDPYANDK